MKIHRLEKVILYNEGASDKLNIEEIAAYLRTKLGKIPVEIKAAYPAFAAEERQDFARALASIKVIDIGKRMTPDEEPLYGEIDFEIRRTLGKTKAFGIIYDGFHLQRNLVRLVAPAERTFDIAHIFFTNRLFATWEEGDSRYHARTGIYGFPSIISTTGFVEAPARPREYYLLKYQYEMLGKDIQEVKDRFKGRFIGYDDELLTEIARGYAMQAVFYTLTGNPFCEDKACRLYNAHWQQELIFAQLESPYEFCEQHNRILNSLN